jgi:cellobiose phosphorylase
MQLQTYEDSGNDFNKTIKHEIALNQSPLTFMYEASWQGFHSSCIMETLDNSLRSRTNMWHLYPQLTCMVSPSPCAVVSLHHVHHQLE